MKKILKKIRYKRLQKFQKEYINKILNASDFKAIVNEKPTSLDKITFVIPGMPPFSGGHTSILRLGSELSDLGHEVKYLSYYDQDIEIMKKNAEMNLKGYRGEIISESLENFKSDIVVATSWDSVYYAKKMNGYKMYFVQDYEPYFHMFGELFIMAKKTYEFGLHMVSLGNWNKRMIEENCNINSKLDAIEFPYEGKEYFDKGRNFKEYKEKSEFQFAVYIKDTGKRAPYLIQFMMKNLKQALEEKGKTVKIKYYGETTDFKCDAGENLGKINKNQLLELYQESDFGVVASLSNISLVPYEMLATGLPIIEFKEGTFEEFFPEGAAIISSFETDEFISKISECIEEPSKLENMSNVSKEYLKTLSWEKSGMQFEEILKNI